MQSAMYPPALKEGDILAMVAPASRPDRKRIERATALLETEGFHVKVFGDLYAKYGYLAGDDEVRVTALMDAFRDDSVRAVLCARGGYGCARLLDRLDYAVIRDHPKALVGFSDVTALHLAIGKKTGLVTFHGPHPNDGPGLSDGWERRTATSFWQAVKGARPGGAMVLTGCEDSLHAIAPGVARGRLTGGNLATLCALMGTPYEIETDAALLFLEDVGERPYRIDRCLAQLRLAGKLDNLAGVILGHFTDSEPEKAINSLSLDDVFRDYFAYLGVPVLGGFPAGHDQPNLTLPLGAPVEINADAKRVSLLDVPVSFGAH